MLFLKCSNVFAKSLGGFGASSFSVEADGLVADGFGQEETDVFSFADGFADEGGTDFHLGGGMAHSHVGGQRRFVYGEAFARVDEDAAKGEDALRAFPFGETEPVVGAHDEAEAALREGFVQGLQRVDGVGRTGEAELEVGGFEAGVALDGGAHEGEAGVVVQQAAVFLERILGADHEPQFVYSLVFAQVIGQSQVADVDGVERAAEYTGLTSHRG